MKKGAFEDPVERRIAEIAGRQHGVVTAKQMLGVEIGRTTISNWARRGRLHRVHQGVYAVGHPAMSIEARWMAAVLACGEGAVLSHLSAAALWDLLNPADGPVDVSLPSQSGRRRRRGIRVHRCATLRDEAHLSTHGEEKRLGPNGTVRRGIPVTSVARTVDDLRRGRFPDYLVRRAERQAGLKRYELSRPRSPWRTRSDLEDDFLAFVKRHRLPLPEVNVKVGRHEVDFLWRAQSLVVETDFYDYHRGETSFEDDHQRDMDLRRMNFTVLRYTGAQLTGYPAEMAGELGEALAGDPVPDRSGPPAS